MQSVVVTMASHCDIRQPKKAPASDVLARWQKNLFGERREESKKEREGAEVRRMNSPERDISEAADD